MKNFEDLSFSDSYMFYAILRKRADLCLQIVELITGRKVASIRLLHAEHDVRITYRSKGVRFDVEFQDERGTAYDLEMQVDVGPDLLKRGRYYRSSLDLEQLKPGEGYQKLRDSFIIFICKSDPFGLGLPRYDIEATCLQDDRVQGDGSHLIFLNASPFKEDEDPEMQAFLNYVADGSRQTR